MTQLDGNLEMPSWFFLGASGSAKATDPFRRLRASRAAGGVTLLDCT